MGRYLGRKLITYVLAFIVGVTIDWLIPRLVPGDPIQSLLSKFQLQPAGYAALYKTFAQAFGTNLPLWQQYLNFWKGLLTGDMGISIWNPPISRVKRSGPPNVSAVKAVKCGTCSGLPVPNSG